MKKVYFVRHGQTNGNEKGMYQVPETSLSDTGLQQAEIVAKRCLNLGAEVVLASTMKRALDTGKAIAKTANIPLVESSLFQEIMRPTVVRNRLRGDPEVLAIMNLIKEHKDDPTWHHSDEENNFDVLARAKKALEFIAARKENTIIVASHGHFLRAMLGVMLFGDDFNMSLYEKMHYHMGVDNTGLSLCELEDNGNWFVKTWNDYAHLGE